MIKPNLIVMGGDQFDETDPREAKMKSSYFSYFYWCTNVAAFLAFSIMVRRRPNPRAYVQGSGALCTTSLIPPSLFLHRPVLPSRAWAPSPRSSVS
jgi:hypothetical protein